MILFADAHRIGYFNSRPSARGDGNWVRKIKTIDISIHAPPRGATILTNMANKIEKFQFTPLREGRPKSRKDGFTMYKFQFTPLREGRHGWRTVSWKRWKFQFTPLREGRHFGRITTTFWTTISIHAPPRGATHQRCKTAVPCQHFNSRPSARGDVPSLRASFQFCLFQFTPLREGRLYRLPRPALPVSFQFTPLREGRPRRAAARFGRFRISIHAPPRGATSSARF